MNLIKNLTFFIMICLAFSFNYTGKPPNANTWSISLNNVILKQSSTDKFGETIELKCVSLNATDTLILSRYICGYSANKATAKLTVKCVKTGEQKEYVNRNNAIFYIAKMPASDLLAFSSDYGFFELHFAIDAPEFNFKQTVLMAKVKIK